MVGPRARLAQRVLVLAPQEERLGYKVLQRQVTGRDPAVDPLMARVETAGGVQRRGVGRGRAVCAARPRPCRGMPSSAANLAVPRASPPATPTTSTSSMRRRAAMCLRAMAPSPTRTTFMRGAMAPLYDGPLCTILF